MGAQSALFGAVFRDKWKKVSLLSALFNILIYASETEYPDRYILGQYFRYSEISILSCSLHAKIYLFIYIITISDSRTFIYRIERYAAKRCIAILIPATNPVRCIGIYSSGGLDRIDDRFRRALAGSAYRKLLDQNLRMAR